MSDDAQEYASVKVVVTVGGVEHVYDMPKVVGFTVNIKWDPEDKDLASSTGRQVAKVRRAQSMTFTMRPLADEMGEFAKISKTPIEDCYDLDGMRKR